MKTDAFIQSVIRENFNDRTVITIAHRLNTIAAYNRVLVMSRGQVVEEGHPYELIMKKALFYDMVMHTGKNADTIINKARFHYESIHPK